MYDAQNLRTTARMIQRRAEYASERDKRTQEPPRSECRVCHRRTDNGSERCNLHGEG